MLGMRMISIYVDHMQAQHTTARSKSKTILSPNLDQRIATLAFAAHDQAIRRVMREAVPHSRRTEVLKEMGDFVGHPISIHMFNAWIAPGRERARFPLVYVEAFCRATGDDSLKRLVLGPALRDLLELGERAAVILHSQARTDEKRKGDAACVR